MVRLLVAIVVLGLGGHAAADDSLVVQGRIELDAMNYPAARATLRRALATGKNPASQLAELYRMIGIAEASIGKPEEARAAFERWIVLVPDAALEEGTSPKIAGPFAAAKSSGASLKVRVTTTVEPPVASLVIDEDPLALVKGARVIVVADGKPEQTFVASGASPIALPLPPGTRHELRVIALDEHGNELRGVDNIVIEKPAEVMPPPPEVPQSPPRARPVYAQWWLWGGVAVLGVGGATYFALQFRSDRDELDALKRDSINHTYAEARDVESRMQRNALFTNIGLAVAGGAAIATVVLYLTRPERHERTLAVVPSRGGGHVVLAVPF